MEPSADERALWAAIRAAPDDDLPRLVYADWLEEHGRGERAELIRVQCRLATLPADRRRARFERSRLKAREAALLAAHGYGWLNPVRAALAGPGGEAPAGLRLVRGFPDFGECGLAAAGRRRGRRGAGEQFQHVRR